VEYKGDKAWSKVNQLSGRNSAHNVIAHCVCQFFRERGVVCRLPATFDTCKDMFDLKRHRVDRYLEWLHSSVRPGVLRAVDKRGLSATLEALGLTKLLLGQEASKLE
jgi:hypothetical protein